MAASTGINRVTGKSLSDWPHVVQSIKVIFSTLLGGRVMRRTFGSAVPGLLGRNLTPSTLTAFFTAIIVAIELWEPRLRVVQILYPQPPNSADNLRAGKITIEVIGAYRPNALHGDFTEEAIPRAIQLSG